MITRFISIKTNTMTTIRKISLLALTLLITGSIDSIRNFPAPALFGSTLIFFVLFAGCLFLIPTALVAAELAANIDEGGIYQWVSQAFGKRVGFLAIWLQWVNNIFWFPTILSFIGSTAVYCISPALSQNKYYLVCAIIVIFWTLTFINLKGIHLSAKFSSFCTVLGLLIPVTLIIGLLLLWLLTGKPLQLQITLHNIMPPLHHLDSWVALTGTMLSFTGMELTTVHIRDVDNPQRNFPRALLLSSIMILLTMLFGSLAIALVLPYAKINLVNGTIQTFAYFLEAYHLSWFMPLLTILLVIGSLGGVVSWVGGPIRGIGQAAQHGFLPMFLCRQNQHHVPQNLLIAQAILVSIVCTAFLFIPNINTSYWLLMGLTTELYMLMYILMLLAALRLRHHMPEKTHTFRIPFGKVGTYLTCFIGLIGITLTLIAGFIPPPFYTNSRLHYGLLFLSGMLLMLLPLVVFYWWHQYHLKNTYA